MHYMKVILMPLLKNMSRNKIYILILFVIVDDGVGISIQQVYKFIQEVVLPKVSNSDECLSNKKNKDIFPGKRTLL